MTNTKIDSEVERFDKEFTWADYGNFDSASGESFDWETCSKDIKIFLRESLTRIATASRESGYELRDKEYAETLQGVVDKAHAEGFAAAIKMVRESIEEYFKGLVVIPFPQKTKESLLNTLPASKE